MSTLHDIPDPEGFLPAMEISWWGWVILGMLCALIPCILFRYLSSRPDPDSVDGSSYSDSRAALEQVLPHLEELSLAEVSANVSLILRNYLTRTFKDQALYETHEEFVLRSDALQDLPHGARARILPLLSTLANAKYTPSRIDPAACQRIIEDSLEILQGLESTRKRRIA